MNKIEKGELDRKAIHFTASLIPLIYYFFIEKQMVLIILGILTSGIIIAELLRMTIPACYRLYLKIFGEITREHEHENHFTGATHVFLGSFFTVYLFPKEIAAIALLFLIVGDPSACLIGTAFGKVRIIGKKTLEGTLSFIIAGMIATFWITSVPLWVKFIGVIAGCIVELIPWNLDDNITIPLISGFIMKLLIA